MAQYQTSEKKDEVYALYRDGYQAEAPAQHELDALASRSSAYKPIVIVEMCEDYRTNHPHSFHNESRYL